MKLVSETRGGTTIVTVDALRIDAAVAIRFKEEMRTAIDTSEGRVVLDLGTVGFIDSSGLGAIVAAMKMLPPGRKMELATLTPTVEKVFRMTRMDSIFTIHETTRDALGTEA